MMAELDILNGFAGKVIGDCIDISINTIKNADKNRKSYDRNVQIRIYQVIIDALNEFTYNKYKSQDKLYDAAEKILKGFKSGKGNTDAIRSGLKTLVSNVKDSTCQDFMKILCHEICKAENHDLYKEIDMLWKKQESEYIEREFGKNNQNHETTHRKLDYFIEKLSSIGGHKAEQYNEIHVEDKSEEYFKKWYDNVFLNDFKKRDKRKGENVKLKDIYLEEHLPHYIWERDDEPSFDLKELLSEYIIDNNDKKMLLILGQPGIGKSTLITWIMANLVKRKDRILVYQFVSELRNIDWQEEDIFNEILETLNLRYNELENKVVILDGFDEIHAGSERDKVLNQLYYKLKEANSLKHFSLIITCRENYVHRLDMIKCDYITLQAWDRKQIRSFCTNYKNVSKSNIAENTIKKILEKKEIFGIPLILYMVLALNIVIDKDGSTVDVYDRIFSLEEGGIYERCIKNLGYASPHRISAVKQQIHQVSQRIAFWIFENNSEKSFIYKKNFKEICDDVMSETQEKSGDIESDVLIGNYFEPIKHCEGIGTDELQFVHRSIYEYFVVVYFYESIHNSPTKEVVRTLGKLLKVGHLSKQILEFVKYKFDSINECNLPIVTRKIFNIMLRYGMTYYIEMPCKNNIEQERNIFANMLKVVGLWNPSLGELNNRIIIYLQCNRENGLNLVGLKVRAINPDMNQVEVGLRGVYLCGANLRGADLSGTDLRGADLSGTDLRGANLSGADLIGADLNGADLNGAELCGANLSGANLSRTDLSGAKLKNVDLISADLFSANLNGADLSEADLNEADLCEADLNEADLNGANFSKAVFDEGQVNCLCTKHDLGGSRVYIPETEEIISYKEYCIRNLKL